MAQFNNEKMTSRAFLTLVIEHILDDGSPENTAILDYAHEQLAALDLKNAQRKATPSKTQEANAPIKIAILGYLTENTPAQYTEMELGAALNITHNKAGSLARQLVAEGAIQSAKVKFPKIGQRTVYFVADTPEDENSDGADAEEGDE